MHKTPCIICATMWALPLPVVRPAIAGDALLPPNGQPSPRSQWIRSTGEDDYRRVLAIRTNQFGGVYAVDQPVPVAVEIHNLGPEDPDSPHPTAQLFPHLDVWVRQGDSVEQRTLELEIPNRLQIPEDDEFEHLFDLRSLVDLSRPGTCEVAVGHLNVEVTDLGDWTGTLRSPFRRIEVVAGE